MKRLLLGFVALSFLLLARVAPAQDPAQQTFTFHASYQHTNLMHPTGLWLDANNNLYIADTDHNQIKVFSNGVLSTLAGSGTAGYADGVLLSAQFNQPTGISGQSLEWDEQACTGSIPPHCWTTQHYYQIVYVNDPNNFVVRSICLGDAPHSGACNSANANTVSTASGSHTQGLLDGPNSTAQFAGAGGLVPAYDITDTGNHAVRTWDRGSVTTYAGTGLQGYVDGFRTNALFNFPVKTDHDSAGNRYVSDLGNSVVRKIDASGNVTTFAGTGIRGYGDGPRSVAQFDSPTGIAYASDNYVYVADTRNNCIRRIDLYGNVTTYAGSTTSGLVDGSLAAARFTYPTEIIISGSYMYVSDSLNNVIRRIDMSAGTVTTIVN